MLVRGQTTEERIAQIANGFGQGVQNYQQGQDRQRTQGLQEEAQRRQQALQALEVEGRLSEQTGKNLIGSGIGQNYLSGNMANIGELMNSAPTTRKAELESQDRQIKADERILDNQYKQSQINRNNRGPVSQPKENLTYQQKLDIKSQHDLESEKLKKPSSDQRKVATFVQRIDQAEKDFISLEEKGFDRGSNTAGIKSMLPNQIKPENIKLQDQAERNFVNAVLRRESGAAIAPSEFSSAELQYFPRAGDSKVVADQKRRNREIVMAGLKAEAGDRAMEEIGQQLKGGSNEEAEMAEYLALKAKQAGG